MIRRLCEEREIPQPEAVYSKTHASEIIDGLLKRSYDPRDHRIPESERAWLNGDDPEREAEISRERGQWPVYDEADVPFA